MIGLRCLDVYLWHYAILILMLRGHLTCLWMKSILCQYPKSTILWKLLVSVLTVSVLSCKNSLLLVVVTMSVSKLWSLIRDCDYKPTPLHLKHLGVNNIEDLSFFDNESGREMIKLEASITDEQCDLFFSKMKDYIENRVSPTIDQEVDTNSNHNDSISIEQSENITNSSMSDSLNEDPSGQHSIIHDSNHNSNHRDNVSNLELNQSDDQIENVPHEPSNQQSGSANISRYDPISSNNGIFDQNRQNTSNSSNNSYNDKNAIMEQDNNHSDVRFDEEKEIEVDNESKNNETNSDLSHNLEYPDWDYKPIQHQAELAYKFWNKIWNSGKIVYNFQETKQNWVKRKNSLSYRSFIVFKYQNDEETPVALVFFGPNEDKDKVFSKRMRNEDTDNIDFIPDYRDQIELTFMGDPDEYGCIISDCLETIISEEIFCRGSGKKFIYTDVLQQDVHSQNILKEIGFTRNDDNSYVTKPINWAQIKAPGVLNNEEAKKILNPSGASTFTATYQCWELSKEGFD